jgi:hypothetical protein
MPADYGGMKVRLRENPMSAHGLEPGKLYEVDDPDHETVSIMEHLTLIGEPGAYPWCDFIVEKEQIMPIRFSPMTTRFRSA